MDNLVLRDSLRLYVGADVAANLKDRLHSPFLRHHAECVLADANGLVRTSPLREGVAPSWQHGTRAIDSRLNCLTAAWVLTHERRYREAAIRHLEGLAAWRQISCEANAETPAEPILPFCLSYGELSCTVGLMYDLFRPDLAETEKRVFFAMLDKFLMKAAVSCLTSPPWWANKIWSNWNGVCAGGMGVMALSFHGDHPDASRMIPFVEGSLGEYFKSYIENGGGCPEGTGYWNYGMNFAMRYLLSWERATGREHPALAIKELGDSLFFPLDFAGISFGDNDGWHPSMFFFLLARRLKQHHAALRAAAYLPERPSPAVKVSSRGGLFVTHGELLYAADAIPTLDEMQRLKAEHRKRKVPVARVYAGMGWGALADDEAFPTLRLALRGGSSKIAGHGMLDLLSFRCRVNGELMITDQQDGGYMSTTFGKRGHELYGRSAESKSTLFVDGVGCHTDVTCDTTEVVRGKDLLGIRIDASAIFIPRWKADHFIGRLVLMVENAYWLLIDHVLSPSAVNGHWMESRFHTLAECKRGQDWVSLRSGKERLQMTFASLNGSTMQESRGMPSQPIAQTTIFRWLSAAAVQDNLHIVALNPGGQRLGLKVRALKGTKGYAIGVTVPGRRTRTIRLSPDLQLM